MTGMDAGSEGEGKCELDLGVGGFQEIDLVVLSRLSKGIGLPKPFDVSRSPSSPWRSSASQARGVSLASAQSPRGQGQAMGFGGAAGSRSATAARFMISASLLISDQVFAVSAASAPATSGRPWALSSPKPRSPPGGQRASLSLHAPRIDTSPPWPPW
jgi:hypothetical protein